MDGQYGIQGIVEPNVVQRHIHPLTDLLARDEIQALLLRDHRKDRRKRSIAGDQSYLILVTLELHTVAIHQGHGRYGNHF